MVLVGILLRFAAPLLPPLGVVPVAKLPPRPVRQELKAPQLGPRREFAFPPAPPKLATPFSARFLRGPLMAAALTRFLPVRRAWRRH